MSAPSPPLQGVRIVEVCPLFPGPLAAKILMSMGAEVIKVTTKLTVTGESSDDDTSAETKKRSRKKQPADEQANAFATLLDPLDDGKERLALDLDSDVDQKRLDTLLASADAVILGFRPGSLDRRGLAPAELRRRFPDLIVCCLSGFGISGPLAHRSGHDVTYLARAGVLGMMPGLLGGSDGTAAIPPAPVSVRPPLPIQVADVAGGTYPVVMQLLAALYGRREVMSRRSGEKTNAEHGSHQGAGCVLDIAMTSNSHALLVLGTLAQQASGGLMDVDNGAFVLCGRAPCYNLYRTSDGRYMAVGALEPKYWRRVVRLLGLPADKFTNPAVQFGVADSEGNKERVAAAFATRSFAEWRRVFEAEDAMVEPVLSPAEASSDAQHRARVALLPHAANRSVLLPGTRLSRL
jgi:alpha-methylacyl-CoA racemase